jgi:hypothetical protein
MSEITQWSQVCLSSSCIYARLIAYWTRQHGISAISSVHMIRFAVSTICCGNNRFPFLYQRGVISPSTSLSVSSASHTILLPLLFLPSPSLSSTVLVPLHDIRRCYRDRKPMTTPEVAITIHAPPVASSRPSEDFELVRHPNHQHTDWKPSHRQEELPFYMTEDTSARRRVTHAPQGPTSPQRNPRWDEDYDGEGKDVYAKANTSQRYGGGGRVVRRAPPPPPTSIVSLHCLQYPTQH